MNGPCTRLLQVISDLCCPRTLGQGDCEDSYLAESGVLSVEELESVLFLSPGVLVFLGTPEPKPMGVGLMWPGLAWERMLEVRRTPLPLLSSS